MTTVADDTAAANTISLEEVYERVQNDPSTQVDPEWMNTWLLNLDDEENEYHYLDGKTLQTIQDEKDAILSRFEARDKWRNALSMYRVVNDLQDLRLGNHIRWIRSKPNGDFLLTNGGILVQTKFLNKGAYVLCKNGKQMMQYELDKCTTFQKMTAEEWVVLHVNASASTSTTTSTSTN